MGNKLQVLTVANVRGYEKDGTVYLNLEDVARGLGFTQTAKSGNEVVRWERVNKYLKEFNFIPTSGDGFNADDFIPENIFYRLAMKAKNEVAEKFQILVADEILPAIRKTGMYTAKPKTSAELLLESAQILYEHEKQLAALQKNQNEQKERIEKIERIINPIDLIKPIKKNYIKIISVVHGLVKESKSTYADIWKKIELELNKKLGINIRQELEKTKESYKQYYYNKSNPPRLKAGA